MKWILVIWSNRWLFRCSNKRGRNSSKMIKYRNCGHFMKRRSNFLGPDGRPARCNVCGCTFHWARNWPHAEENIQNNESEICHKYSTNQSEARWGWYFWLKFWNPLFWTVKNHELLMENNGRSAFWKCWQIIFGQMSKCG